jgi:hypothetical protein
MKQLLLILKNYKRYRYWKAKRKGKKFRDYKRGAGFYLIIGLFGHNPYNKRLEVEMKSGNIGVYELIEYKTYTDPDDMVEFSWWNFIGYKNMKPIHECSFHEFISIYAQSNV